MLNADLLISVNHLSTFAEKSPQMKIWSKFDKDDMISFILELFI